MGCNNGIDPNADHVADYWDRHPSEWRKFKDALGLKDALCSACSALERAGIPIPAAALPLWERHKQEDENRKAQEDAEEKRRILKQSGIAKLSAEEQDALGIR